MKILYIITSMHNSAGMERTIANKTNFLVKKGHEVSILTTDQKGREYFYQISDKVNKYDLEINFCDENSKNFLLRTISFIYKNYLFKKRLKQFLFNNEFDVVVTLILKSTDFLYKIHDGSVKIVEHHFSRDYYKQLLSSKWNNISIRFAYKFRDSFVLNNLKKYDSFVVLTEEDASEWKKKLTNVSVIPNSINYDSNLKANLEKKHIISIGRLEYQKGYDILIPIWKNISNKYPEWKLTIYGDGSKRSELIDLINKYGLNDSLFIKPPVSNVESVILESSIYLLPSRFEGLPMVLLESMSLGLPPIAFQCKCGPKDIIDDGINGFLVDCGNEKLFAERISYLIENFSERKEMGKMAKEKMFYYSHEQICLKWENLFMKLLSKKGNKHE